MATKDTDPKGSNPKDDDLDSDAGQKAYVDARQGVNSDDLADMFYYTPQKPNMDEVFSSMKFSGVKPEDVIEGMRQDYQDYLCKVAADPTADPSVGSTQQDPKTDAQSYLGT